MKNFKAYLSESAYASDNPVTGDDFGIQISMTESIETYVLEHDQGSVTLAADEKLIEILEQAGLLERSTYTQSNSERSEDNDLEESDYEDYEDEDEPNSDQGFFVVITNEESGPFVGLVSKDGGKWRERGGTGNAPHNWGGTYMSYLTPEEVIQWIRQDYGRHSEVKGPFYDEDKAYDYANMMSEAEYQGRKVTLNKPTRGDVKKFKVFVKDPKTGNVKKVNFGHGGTSADRPTMRIRKSNPKARKSFRARHKCASAKDKTTARYWSCRKW